MKIAIITEGYFPELSGVTTSLAERLRWLSQWGHTIRVYAPDYGPLEHLYPDYGRFMGEVMPNVTVFPYPSKPYYVAYARDPVPFSFWTVARNLRSFKPDVVHAECPERLFLGFGVRPGIGVAKKLGVPTTAFYHTNYLSYIDDYREQIAWLGIPGIVNALRRLLVWVYNSYDLTMVTSTTTEDELKSFGVRNTRHEYFNGVDLSSFSTEDKSDGKNRRTESNGTTDFLYVGRLTPDKQIGRLLEIFDGVRARVSACHFWLVGDGPEMERVQAWASKHGDATVTGRVPFEQVAQYYHRANIFVTASPKETGPLTALEAMAAEVPVVGPRAGGIIDLVQEGVSGFLLPPEDVQGFVAALSRLAADPELRQAMGLAGKERSLERTWEGGAERMVTVWQELLNGRKAHGSA